MAIEYWEVARMADCPSTPEGKDTEGAKWLVRVFEDAVDIINQYDEVSEDAMAETADGLVPIYTNHLWNVWVDCGGYNNDGGQYRDFASANDVGDMMNRVAQADCYEWAMNVIQFVVRGMK